MGISNKIKTLSDAYEARGLKREDIVFANPENKLQVAADSFIDAMVLTEALNGGRKPNYDNGNERKWEIWWDMTGEAAGGSGFSLSCVNNYYSYSYVGARLVFFEKEIAEYAAKEFPEVYKPFMKFAESES